VLAIFVGIWAEQLAVEKRIEVLERPDAGAGRLALGSYREKPLVLCRTGMGEERAQAALSAVFERYAPTAVVSARLAGAVQDEIRLGQLVFCRRTYLCRRGAPPVIPEKEGDRRLLDLAELAARNRGLPYVVSEGLTGAPPTAEPVDRPAVLAKFPVAVVDTEGYWLEQAAAQRGVPFLSVRASLGRAFDRAPYSLELGEKGALDPRKVIACLLRRPGRVRGFVGLALSMRVAAKGLSRFMGGFLHEWSLEA